MQKRALLASFTFPPEPNGVAHAAKVYADALVAMGFRVFVATNGRAASHPQDRLNGKLSVLGFSVSGNGRLESPYRGDVNKYRDYVLRGHFDIAVFHAWHCWSTDIILPYLDDLAGKKILVSHGTWPVADGIGLHWALRWLNRAMAISKLSKAMASFDRVVFLTRKRDKERFIDRDIYLRKGLRNGIIIPNTVAKPAFDAESVRLVCRKYGVTSPSLAIYVSNYSEMKNQEEAIRVFDAAAIDGSQLILIGSMRNSYSEHLRFKYRFLVRNGRLRIMDGIGRPDLWKLLSASKVFICTSRYEIQPIVLIEAMAAGVPYVAYDIGCIDEMRGGYVAKDASRMIGLVRKLLAVNDPEMRRRLRDRYKDRYHPSRAMSSIRKMVSGIWTT
jgi:glycosyltransferase involved in cell wall biosynthesis